MSTKTNPFPSSCLKTANDKIPASSVFNDSEGLYRKTVCRCLVHRPHYSARLMRFGSRGLSEFVSRMRHRSSGVPYKRESPTLPDKTKFEPVLEAGI